MYAEKTKEVTCILANNDGRIIEKWFTDTHPLIADLFRESPSHYLRWLEIIVVCSGTHWELFIQLLRESLKLLQILTLDEYQKFLYFTRAVSRIDVKSALAVLRTSLLQFTALNPEMREQFLDNCRDLFAVDWEGSLAYYNSFPLLAGRETGEQADYWNEVTICLSKNAPSLLKDFLNNGPAVREKLSPKEMEKWLQTGLELEKIVSAKIAALYLKYFAQVIQSLGDEDKDILNNWTQQVLYLSLLDLESLEAFMHNSPRALKVLGTASFSIWWQLGAKITILLGKAGAEYYKTSINIARETSISDMVRWTLAGLKLEGDERKLKLFFACQSRESQEALKSQQLTLFLEKEQKTLQKLAEASFDIPVLIRNRRILPKELFLEQPLLTLCDGQRVYMPEKINAYADGRQNFKLYKLMLFHQLAHITYGTYDAWAEISSCPWEQTSAAEETQLFQQLLQTLLDGQADRYLLKSSPRLIRDFRLLLEGFLQRLSALSDSNPGGISFMTFLTNSLPLEDKVYTSEILTPQQIKDKAIQEYEKLLQNGTVSSFQQLFTAYRVPYRGIIRQELLEAAELVRSRWETHGDQLNGKKLIALTGNRFFTGRDVTFYRHLLDCLILLHRQEADEGFTQVAFYDEWDWTLDDYKKDWCRVREYLLQPVLNNSVENILEEYSSLVTMMKKYFAMLRPDRVKKLKRQPEGEHLDLDAIVEAMVEKKIGLADASNLYIRRDKRKRDVAVAFLLDCSGSSDEVVSAGKTILDLEKEAVVIMAEALEMLGDIFAVYAFSSNGRHEVDFHVVKEFEEAYSSEVRKRFGRLESANMTRLAASIRHALAKIQRVRASVRLLFILSDGRPFDMDYRARVSEEKKISRWLREDESLYPQADTRMALWEAKAGGITPFCITVDKHAKEYMDQTFGRVGYILLNKVDLLPVKLPEIYRRLTT